MPRDVREDADKVQWTKEAENSSLWIATYEVDPEEARQLMSKHLEATWQPVVSTRPLADKIHFFWDALGSR